MRAFLWIPAILLIVAGCGQRVPDEHQARILMLGDSMLASNSLTGRSASRVVEAQLGEEVIDRAVPGARMIYALPLTGAAGMNIPRQYRPGEWDWVVLNGGGNDLLLGCGCMFCSRKMEQLISEDGRRGAIPGFVSRLRQDGAQVLYVGYLRLPGLASPIRHCREDGDELEARIARLAELDAGVHFLSLVDLVPHGDGSYHAFDRIHPSVKGSAAIGKRIASMIEPDRAPPD